MSRIAGCADAPLVYLAPALAEIPQPEGAKTIQQAGLAWRGHGTPRIYQIEGYTVVLDGTLYNPEDFIGLSDAERLCRAFITEGVAATLSRVNGDFACAFQDNNTGALWLARDRFGLKPLYYADTGRGFWFASQLQALLALPFVSRDINQDYLARFAGLHYRYIDNACAQTPMASIQQLPAAHWLRYQAGQYTIGQYWDLKEQGDFTQDATTLSERYQALLLDAVSRRYKAHARHAFTLSGGMDSSSVLSSAVRQTGQKQQAYSTVYADATYDESDEIKTILSDCVDTWHQVPVDEPAVFEDVPQLVALHGEPVATATWLSHHKLCQQVAADGYHALFGGLGGDELNAGEYEHFFYFFADLKHAADEATFAHEVACWVRHHDHPIFKKSRAILEDTLAQACDFKTLGRCLPEPTRLSRYQSALRPDFLADFVPMMPHPFQSYLKNRTYQDIFLETLPCCVRAEDRQTSAAGLDNVLPFLDHRLVEFMFQVPATLKVKDGVTKHLLREAMRGILPESTRTRIKKTGWNAPAHLWFSGPGGMQMQDIIHSRAFDNIGLYDVAAVQKLLQSHQTIIAEGRVEDNHMMFFWQLLNVYSWTQWLNALPQLSLSETSSSHHSETAAPG